MAGPARTPTGGVTLKSPSSVRRDRPGFACFFEDSYDAQYFASVAGNFQNGRFVIGARDGTCDSVGGSITNGSRYGSY